MGARARNLARNSAVQKQLRSVNIVTGAAVHGLEICHDGSTDVQYSRGNEDCSLRARQVVLAAGTLGNSRILSRCSFVSGSDLVGSGFMDHVSARVLKLDVTDWDRFLDVFAYRRYKGVLAAPRIVPHPQYLANRDIVPSYAHFEIASAPGGMVDVAKSFRGARQGNGPYPKAIEMLDAGRRDFWPTASAVGRSLLRHERPVLKSSTVYLRIDAEQPHRPENFIAWNGSKPYASRDLNLEMKWHVGTREKTAIEVMKKDVEAVLDRFNIGGSFEPLRNKFEITDTYHLMGGTAMQTAARPGVVDKECRVLGSQNVFVAGASVFPSGGMANPTFTALALAHRLGEQLG
ncbi:GMC family oxidoreductase [Arthrobacter sp. OAP107]|uniref:GMC family oxidoreductase n=1 Tax=Arthrobacter sp. OAP107 TaxID=3156445 RepID=UPI00339093BA